MSCHGCATRFGLFTKENGCPACGFAYCSSCLKFKCQVPSLGSAQHRVCKKCFARITSNNEVKDEPIPPPDSFLKRLESLENPTKPPITVYHTDKRTVKLKRGLSEKDLEIFHRLEKLRADRKPDPKAAAVTEEEIARRLAVLRGQNPDIMVQKPHYTAPDPKTQQEQSNDLIKQASEELKLDSQIPCPEDEILERLRRLRSNDSDTPSATHQPADASAKAVPSMPSLDEIAESLIKSGPTKFKDDIAFSDGTSSSKEKVGKTHWEEGNDHEMNSSCDDEDKIKKIISKAEDLVRIERENEGMELDDPSSDQEELPWCCICNDDATRRCVDCENDLYCDGCFREGHKDLEMKTHQTVPYSPPKK